MSTYKEIHGLKIKKVSSDPPAPQRGQMWYNTTTGSLRVRGLGPGVFTTGGNMNTKRSSATAGTVTAGLASHGYGYSPSPVGGSVATEEYDGTSWTSVNNANTARYQTSAVGSQTASVVFGGLNGTGDAGPYTMSTSFEGYNGTTWTNLTAAPTAKAGGPVLIGTSTLLVQVAGNTNGSGEPGNGVQEYNGSWSAGENYPISVQSLSGAGTQTAAVLVGGATAAPGTPLVTTANEYDGTDFSATGGTPVATRGLGGRAGTQTSAFFAGGFPSIGTCLDYDGSNFSVNPATPGLTTPSFGFASMSNSDNTNTSALACGRGPTSGDNLFTTEEYAGPSDATTTVTTS